jgi:hypothetical protein
MLNNILIQVFQWYLMVVGEFLDGLPGVTGKVTLAMFSLFPLVFLLYFSPHVLAALQHTFPFRYPRLSCAFVGLGLGIALVFTGFCEEKVFCDLGNECGLVREFGLVSRFPGAPEEPEPTPHSERGVVPGGQPGAARKLVAEGW